MARYGTKLTARGIEKLTQAQMTSNKLQITHLAVGDANGAYYMPTGAETVLRKEVWRGAINKSEIDTAEANRIVVEGVVPASVGGFTIREVALYDADGDMIAVGNYPETPKTTTADGTAIELIIRTVIRVDNVDNVDVTLDPNVVIANVKYVDEEIAGVTTQLAHKAGKTDITTITAQLEQTNQQLEQKANDLDVRKKTESITLNDASPDLLQAISGGSTLNVLSTPKADSVTIAHIAGKSDVVNLFDKTKRTLSKYVNNGGIISDSPIADMSEFISVTPNKTYTISNTYSTQGGYYDAQLNWVGVIGNLVSDDANPITITIPTNVYFVRLTVAKSVVDTFMFVQSPALPSEYVPYGASLEWLKVEEENLKDKAVTLQKVDFIESREVNLFNKNDTSNEVGIITPTGLVTNSNYIVSHYIPVKEFGVYIRPSADTTVVYDRNKSVLPSIASGSGIVITMPANAAFVRINVRKDMLDTAMFVKNEQPTEYFPYGLKDVQSAVLDDYVKQRKLLNEAEAMEIINKVYSNKKWVVIGDSLTERNVRTTKSYHDYISDELGITIINMGVSGTGYKQKEGSNNAFYQRISNVPTDADVVTIFGSGNDLSLPLGTVDDTTTETVFGAIDVTLNNYYQRCPVTPIGIISPTPWISYPNSTQNNLMAQYASGLKEICKRKSIPFLDLYNESNLRPWDATARTLTYSKDNGNGVHPDETGHKIVAPSIREFIKSLI